MNEAVKAEMPVRGSKLNCAHFILSHACVNDILQASKNCHKTSDLALKGFSHFNLDAWSCAFIQELHAVFHEPICKFQ